MSSEATILFVCTGNIFRSMTAEYALRAALESNVSVHVHSAGLTKAPHEVMPFVKDYLNRKGIDVSGHVPKKLNQEMLSNAHLSVAMDVEHRQQIQKKYKQRVPIFSEVAYNTESPLVDVSEAIPDWRRNEAAARKYAWSIMDIIFDGMPGFISRMSSFIRQST